MPEIIELSSLAESGPEPYIRLTEAQLRNRLEPEMGLFIAESPKVIAAALDAGCAPVSLLMERRHIRGQGAELIRRCGVPVYTADRALLQELTGYALTRGILCAMRRPRPLDLSAVCAGARRIAVLENLVDSTNIGALFRSAAALGIDGLLLSPSCSDPLNRRAVRVSMGTVFKLPWAYACPDAASWPQGPLAALREAGFQTAALALREDALSIDDPRPAAAERLALLLGTEGDGLTAETVAACDYTLRIPMSHGVDSLNVAAAGAVAFWALRAR